ncbi:MAG: hypothetical protein RRX95_01220 [Oscillospiraceae bacterium]
MRGTDLFEKMTDINHELITCETKKSTKPVFTKWLLPLAACFALMIAVIPFVQRNMNSHSNEPKPPIGENNSVQIANPFIDCKDLEQAIELSGFKMTLPNSVPNWHTDILIRAIKSNMIEVIYQGNDNEMRLRKGVGNGDISGEFKQFDCVKEITVGDVPITLKGSEPLFYVATWIDGDYTYSLTIQGGFSEKEMTGIIGDVK